MRSKLDTRGRTGIFVGDADDHAGNVYRFINIQTKKIILSTDIQWLNSFWKEYKKRKDDSKKLVDVFYSHDEDDQTQEESETEELKVNEIEETKDSGDGNNTEEQKKLGIDDRIPSTNPGAEPPRDARDSGSARSHSTHLETSSSNRP